MRKTYKLYIGGAFPRSESGRVPFDGRAAHERRAGVAQGPARRGPGRARRARGWSGAHRVQPRPDPLPRRRDAGGARGRARRPLRRARRRSRRAIDRWVWYAGWTDKLSAGARRRRTPSPGRTSTSPCPSRPAWSASSRRTSRRCWGSSSRLAPVLVGGNIAVVHRLRGAPARGGRARRGAGDLRRAGRRGQHPHRPARRAGAVARGAPRRRRARPRPAATPSSSAPPPTT